MQQDTYDDDATLRGSSAERDVTPHLVHLDDMSELQVADGDQDIRGWDVRTADGEKIGTVKDLLVDTSLMKVRYIEAQIDKAVLNAGDDRHVLIPIGSARLDDNEDDVYLTSAIVDPRTLPAYDRTSFSREYERSLQGQFPTGSTTGMADNTRGTESATSFVGGAAPNADQRITESDFFSGELYDDERFFGRRRRGREGSNYIGPIDDRPLSRGDES